MGKAIFGLVLLLFLNISLFGQVSDFERIFSNKDLKQLNDGSLGEINFIDKAKGKTIVLKSSVKGCKWILEEMAYYNKLKSEHPGEFDVFIAFSDDVGTMSKYIQEVNFDFSYIYDPEMILSQKHFPKDTTYSVLFDSNGNIQEINYSGRVSHDKILNQLNKPQIKSPINQFGLFPTAGVVLNFQIKRYDLGDEVLNNCISLNRPTKIMTGYKANESIDTIEGIKICTLSGKNILDLYSYAFNLPKNRFIYDKELEYIDSHAPNNRYTLNLSVSNLHADLNKMLIQQINLNFGLEILEILEKTETFVLSKIDTGKNNIKIINDLNQVKTLNTTISENTFRLSTTNINAVEISRLIEEATKMPVEVQVDPNLRYSVDILIENKDKTTDNLIKLFLENGLIIHKEKKEVKKLKINRTAINRMVQ